MSLFDPDEFEEQFKKQHSFLYFIDHNIFKDKSIFNYAPHYIVFSPWKFVEELSLRIKWAWQRVCRGWDDRVLWDLDTYLAKNIATWLQEIKKNKCGVPSMMFSSKDFVDDAIPEETVELRRKEYEDILEKISYGFIQYYDGLNMCDPKQYRQIKRDLKISFGLMYKYFETLWQ